MTTAMASGTDFQRETSGQAAIDRFAAMMIERMQQMKDTGWKQGWIGGASGYAGLPQNVGWPKLFRFQFLLSSDAYCSHELPASGISDLQAGA